jgi:hypothetical protein
MKNACMILARLRAGSRALRILAGAGALASSLTLSAAAAGAAATPASFFGMVTVQSDDYPLHSLPPGTFPVSPVGFIGHPPEFAWGWIETQRGVFDWSTFDKYAQAAAQHGVDLVLTFGWTPGWAVAPGTTHCHTPKGTTLELCSDPPANLNDWRDFISQVVRHYNGTTAPHIRFYELWNEANTSNYWTGDVPTLVSMAKVAYQAIKQYDTNTVVLTPSVVGPLTGPLPDNAPQWTAQYLQQGGAQWADAGSFHGYLHAASLPHAMPESQVCPVGLTGCFGPIDTYVQEMRTALDSNGMEGRDLYDTEGSWGDGDFGADVTDAAWLARWYLIQAGLADTTRLKSVHWFTWGLGAGGQQAWGGIENPDESPTPAGVAYGWLTKWLVGSTFQGSCGDLGSGVWSCTLTRSNGRPAQVVWSVAQGGSTYTAASQYTQYQDLAGKLHAIPAGNHSLSLGAEPILLLPPGNPPG